ncbi:MAG: hypothetical protein FJX83_07025 [Bacteroidetes bacterium]|nr:hypothetical protein [Bacteroidota bacterium]
MLTIYTDSHAFRKYKSKWAQIDAPRHYHIFTNKGIENLAKQNNMFIKYQISDSNAFQFWGSEQYVNDIPLHHQNSYGINPKSFAYSKSQMRTFARQANQLNEKGDGDMRAYFLQKSNINS